MEFLSSIGGLAIIGLVIYALIMYQNNKESEERVHKEILKKSTKAQDLVHQHKGSQDELEKKLKKIAKDPTEKKNYLNKIKRENEVKEKYKQRLIDNRIFGYKHEIDIFKIFDTNRELSAFELVIKVQTYYNINIDNARDLINTWAGHSLISYCSWGHYKREVGSILKDELYNLSPNDLTLEKWLIQNKKELKEESIEEKQFYNRARNYFD